MIDSGGGKDVLTETKEANNDLVQRGRLLSQEEVLAMWPISLGYLSRLTNHKNPEKRLPSYQFGRRRMYSFNELQWFMEKNRYDPKGDK